MKLQSEKLRKLAKARGITREQLATAVERDGFKGTAAQTAINNWLVGREKPTPTATDARALAQAVGIEPKDLIRFVSKVNNHRGSPQKARLVADLIRGKSFDEADRLLTFSQKRAATNVRKALHAAKADAEANGADERSLVVSESRVDEGAHIKRFQPKDRGRAHPILKRTSHITIGLSDTAADAAINAELATASAGEAS